MPIALDRDETAPVSLRSDEHKPEAERPVFLFYHLTQREVRQVDAWKAEIEKAETIGDIEGVLDRILRLGLAGWRNIVDRRGEPIPFSLDEYDAALTLSEKMELATRYPYAIREIEAKKKSASASRSTSNTAASAPAASESAATPPPPTAPYSSTESPAQSVAALAV